MRIVLAISGASGVIYGIRMLEALKKAGVETHLILSEWACKTIVMETDYVVEDIIKAATYYHEFYNMGAGISSGSFQHDGMVIVPCSMKTLSGISHGLEMNLIIRAASVTLKEQRKLILMPRETPLTSIHLENMLTLARMGVLIMPPMPALYSRTDSLSQVIDSTVGRVLDHLKVEHSLVERWSGSDEQT